MAVRTETETIGDHEFSATQWNVQKAILMKLRLTKILGPALASLAKGVNLSDAKEKKTRSTDSEQLAAFGDALQTLFQSASPEDLVKIINDCLIGVALDGKRLTETTINEHFAGDNLMQIYQVFFFVLRVNYAGFMKGQLAESFLVKFKENL